MIVPSLVGAICKSSRSWRLQELKSLSLFRSETLVAGNVITIEPGCYVPTDPSYPKHFHGLGIRIEVCPHIVEVSVIADEDIFDRTISLSPRTAP